MVIDMGYNMDMTVHTNKTLNNMQKMFPYYTFENIHDDFINDVLYSEEYGIPEDEQGRFVTWSNFNIFKNFFKPRITNDTSIIIDKETYIMMIWWLEEKLKSQTLYDCACNDDFNSYETMEMIRVYRQMKKEVIDFETEFVVYHHDW